MKKTLLLMLGILLISLASAEVTQTNFIKYGTINSNGDLVITLTPVNGASAVGFVCSNSACSSISGTLWNGNVLTSSGNQLTLTYPTSLQSQYGYGVYIYKEGYIPYEIAANWYGTGVVNSMDGFLTKKEMCNSALTSFSATINQQTLNVATKVHSPIEHAGLLDYVPSQLANHYSTKTDITLEVINSEGLIVYTQTKQVTAEYSKDASTSFSTNLNPGSYKVNVYTKLDNEPKCLNYTSDSKLQNINVSYSDNDGDGYSNDVDCNDGDANVWKILTGYVDGDGDGYGAGSQQNVCSGNSLPSGYVTVNGDCNDNNTNAYPGKTEIFDGLDNDCNEQIDEGWVALELKKDWNLISLPSKSQYVEQSKFDETMNSIKNELTDTEYVNFFYMYEDNDGAKPFIPSWDYFTQNYDKSPIFINAKKDFAIGLPDFNDKPKSAWPELIEGQQNAISLGLKSEISVDEFVAQYPEMNIGKIWEWNAEEKIWAVSLPNATAQEEQEYITEHGYEKLENLGALKGHFIDFVYEEPQETCQITSAQWVDVNGNLIGGTSVVEETLVYLDVEGTNCNWADDKINFEVFEYDGVSDNSVNVNPDYTGYGQLGLWIAEWQDDDGTNPEYYFVAKLNGTNQIVSSGTNANQLLTVTVTAPQPVEPGPTLTKSSKGFDTLEFGVPVTETTQIIYEDTGTINLGAKKEPAKVLGFSTALIWLLGIGAVVLLMIVLIVAGLKK